MRIPRLEPESTLERVRNVILGALLLVGLSVPAAWGIVKFTNSISFTFNGG